MLNAPEKKPTHHLHDMVIHSVAFVDRGANNKRWLIAKRADEAMPPVVAETPSQDESSSEVAPNEQPVIETPPTVEPAPDPAEIEKGRRIAQERLARMWSAISSMHDILKDLVAEVTAPPPAKPAAEPTGLEIAMGDLTKRAQDEELARLRKIRGSSNAIPVDGSPGGPVEQSFVWPHDMNDLRTDPRFRRGQ